MAILESSAMLFGSAMDQIGTSSSATQILVSTVFCLIIAYAFKKLLFRKEVEVSVTPASFLFLLKP
jgi:hypothetical protein